MCGFSGCKLAPTAPIVKAFANRSSMTQVFKGTVTQDWYSTSGLMRYDFADGLSGIFGYENGLRTGVSWQSSYNAIDEH